jgi:hypothetical protein
MAVAGSVDYSLQPTSLLHQKIVKQKCYGLTKIVSKYAIHLPNGQEQISE